MEGMVCLHRKNNLARNLLKMRKRFPDRYNFFPETYLLPSDYNEFASQFKGKLKTFIIKPEGAAQGRGIFLVQSADQVPNSEHLIAQKYVTKPYLIDGLKFDLRVYVLVAGCDPLRIYVYKEGLARFATAAYTAPSKKNLGNTFMHLTNYAINKHNPDFKENVVQEEGESGHKLSMSYAFSLMKKQGANIEALWNDIKLIAVKALCAGQPQLAHCYRSAQPDDKYNHMCFEVLGLDILVNGNCKPLLLEVNHTPSFTTGSKLDFDVKGQLIRDALVIMNICPEMRNKIILAEKREREERVLTGKRVKLSKGDRETLYRDLQRERDEYIVNHLGNFDEAYPSRTRYHNENIEAYLDAAREEYCNATGASPSRKLEPQDASPMEANRIEAFRPKMVESMAFGMQRTLSIDKPDPGTPSGKPSVTTTNSRAHQEGAAVKAFRMTDGAPIGRVVHKPKSKPSHLIPKHEVLVNRAMTQSEEPKTQDKVSPFQSSEAHLGSSNMPLLNNDIFAYQAQAAVKDRRTSFFLEERKRPESGIVTKNDSGFGGISPPQGRPTTSNTNLVMAHNTLLRATSRTVPKPGIQPQAPTKRDQVFNRIADSLSEVKAIIDNIPNRINRLSEHQNGRDVQELASLMEAEGSYGCFPSSSIPFQTNSTHGLHSGFDSSGAEVRYNNFQNQDNLKISRPLTTQSRTQMVTVEKTPSGALISSHRIEPTPKVKGKNRPLARFGYANQGMMRSALKRGLTVTVQRPGPRDRDE